MKTLNYLSIVLIACLFILSSCQKESDNIPTPDYNIESLQPAQIWTKFSEDQQMDILTAKMENENTSYYIDSFEIEYWNYPIYENNKVKSIEFPILGKGINSESPVSSNVVINQSIPNSDMFAENETIEAGNANINFWFENSNSLTTEQLMINVQTSQEELFGLESNTTKFYISSGTGKYKNKRGFAYVKFEIEKEASFGCYPNNPNFPDSFEDGTCGLMNDCLNDCQDGAGKGKLFLVGFLNEK